MVAAGGAALEAVDYIAKDQPQAAAARLEELLELVAKLDRVDTSRVVILTLRHWRRAWDPTDVVDGV